MLFGDAADGGWYFDLMRSGQDVGDIRETLGYGDNDSVLIDGMGSNSVRIGGGANVSIALKGWGGRAGPPPGPRGGSGSPCRGGPAAPCE